MSTIENLTPPTVTNNGSSANGQPVLAAFRAKYPLNLFIHDGKNQTVMYIKGGNTTDELYIEITNVSDVDYHLPAITGKKPSATDYQLELRFRPGTLSNAEAIACHSTIEGQTWSVTYQKQADGSQSLYLSAGSALTWPAKGTGLTLILTGYAVNSVGGARVTRIEMLYESLLASNSQKTLSGSRTQVMQILGDEGQQVAAAPFYFGVDGSKQILNDGTTANTFSLLLANNTAQPIALSTDETAPSKVLLTFLGGKFSQNPDWELAKVANLQAMQVTPPNANWTVVSPSDESTSATWTFTAPTTKGAAITSPLRFLFKNLYTKHPIGAAQVLLQYENIPNYPDGQCLTFLEKSFMKPLTTGELEVVGNTNIEGGMNLPYPNNANDGITIGEPQEEVNAGLCMFMPEGTKIAPFKIASSNQTMLTVATNAFIVFVL